jgi:dihydrodipicolinate synthase/N-acetylneuraminate lyase
VGNPASPSRSICYFYTIPAHGGARKACSNPVPIKHCLWRQGLIGSPECRLPPTRVSDALAAELDRALGR